MFKLALPLAATGLMLCSACSSLGPDYVRPKVELPENWKTVQRNAPVQWRPAQPADSRPKQDWWVLFGDETLNELETRALAN